MSRKEADAQAQLALHVERSLLDAMLGLSETQLLAQIADETSLDGRTMGVLAFNGALLAADIAAKDVLGAWWWTPLPFLVIAIALCLRWAFAKSADIGPRAFAFYTAFGGQPDSSTRRQLLAELDEAVGKNAIRVLVKASYLRYALGVLVAGLAVVALSIILE